jgi:hypothetical protein
MEGPRFTVAVLLYGDYPELTERCLRPIMKMDDRVELRIGANDVSEGTKEVLKGLLSSTSRPSATLYSGGNILKYPRMLEMLHLPEVTTPYLMWFDDDSYIDVEPHGWLDLVESEMNGADMLGSVYSIGLRGQQHSWIMRQKWYARKPVFQMMRVSFVTGGWWTIRPEILYRHGWPPQDLVHNGGDVMLGELCRQKNYRIKHFNTGVCINADECGRESQAARRGYTEDPVGFKS